MSTRILVVKLAALGDAVMASTLVPAIRDEWPDAHVTWAAGTGIAPLVRAFDGVDRVVEVDDGALMSGTRLRAVVSMLKAWRDVGRGYDIALIAHTDARYALIARMSGAANVRRFADARGPRAGRWHGAEYLRLVSEAAAERKPIRFPQLRLSTMPTPALLAAHTSYIVVAPGGGRNVLRDDPLRRWPIESWAAAVQNLVQRGHRVVCVGGPADAVEGARCAAAGATDMTGRTSLMELFDVIRNASLIISHDAGPMHLALLADRPLVALFGPTRPDERIPPWADARVLSSAPGLACAPCYDGHGYAPCALNLCLTRVSASDVVSAVERHLAGASAARVRPTF